MINITILPKCLVPFAKEKYDSDYVISIADPDVQTKDDSKIPFGCKDRKVFLFHDIDVPKEKLSKRFKDFIPPSVDIIQEIFNFVDILPESCNIVVNCFAGVSRSSAVAYSIYCKDLGEGNEEEAMRKTLISAPLRGIWPNDLVVKYADQILNRNGKMISAMNDWKKTFKEENPNYI